MPTTQKLDKLDKLDKRSKALRDNLRKRKLKAKEQKGRPPHVDDKTPDDPQNKDKDA